MPRNHFRHLDLFNPNTFLSSLNYEKSREHERKREDEQSFLEFGLMEDGKRSYDSDSSSPVCVEKVRGGVQDLQAPLLRRDGFLQQHNVTSPPLLRRIFPTREDSEWMRMRGSVVCIGVEMNFKYASDAVYYYTGTGVVVDARLVLTVASLFEAPEQRKDLGDPTVKIHITTDISPNVFELARGEFPTSVPAFLLAWCPPIDPDDLVLPHKYFSRANTDMETNLCLLRSTHPIPNHHSAFPHHRRKGTKIQLCTFNQMPFGNNHNRTLQQMQSLYAPDRQPSLDQIETQASQLQPGKFSVASTSLWKGVKYKPYSRLKTHELTRQSSVRDRKIADCKKLTSDHYSSCICYRINTLGGSAGGALCVDGKWVGIHMGQVKYLEVDESTGEEKLALNEHSCGIGLWLDSRKASQWLRIHVPLYCEMKRRPEWVQFGM